MTMKMKYKLNLKRFDRPASTSPFIDDDALDWANRKDLPDFWLKSIQNAFNREDWRGAIMYVYITYMDTMIKETA
jgi:hypothetical protein